MEKYEERINLEAVRITVRSNEAGRPRAAVIENWIVKTMGFEQAKGISQVFVERSEDGSIAMLLTNITEYLLIAGDIDKITDNTPVIGEKYLTQ